MSNLTFQYDEEMMVICLKANGYSLGWDNKNWVPPGMNGDHFDLATEYAFKMLLESKNLYGKQFDRGWK